MKSWTEYSIHIFVTMNSTFIRHFRCRSKIQHTLLLIKHVMMKKYKYNTLYCIRPTSALLSMYINTNYSFHHRAHCELSMRGPIYILGPTFLEGVKKCIWKKQFLAIFGFFSKRFLAPTSNAIYSVICHCRQLFQTCLTNYWQKPSRIRFQIGSNFFMHLKEIFLDIFEFF